MKKNSLNMFQTFNKIRMVVIKNLFIFFIINGYPAHCFSQQTVITESDLVQKFYVMNHQNIYWFSSGKNIIRALEWLSAIDAGYNVGWASNKFQTDQIRTALYSNVILDDKNKEKTDKQITGLVLNFIQYLQQGSVNFDYDEISVSRDSIYIHFLLNSDYLEPVSKIVSRLDCKEKDYLVLKKFLNDSISKKDTLKYKMVLLAMNYQRYLSINHQPEYIIVNISSAEAVYFRNDSLKIKMRTVVGMKKHPTPVIASYMTSIETFPYWSVPHSIAVNEILPKVQKNENYLEQNNFDVVNANNNLIDDQELNWKSYTAKNFPYYFRQSTGSDNSLGVLKFDMKNPFSIFLHATSWQGAFANEYRFLSHGCIRLEKPFELADALMKGKIDIKKLKTGKKNTRPSKIMLPHKIPTFIIYMPVKVDGEKVIFLPDVYGLIK